MTNEWRPTYNQDIVDSYLGTIPCEAIPTCPQGEEFSHTERRCVDTGADNTNDNCPAGINCCPENVLPSEVGSYHQFKNLVLTPGVPWMD